ncbi:uncharacterized protein LOC124545612 [Schistocerca americana]|uniref:uncharacterized protein LOC124545612 n=1 Tax=Schistocerca americana TaxID=7009 RepID=UPI001F502F5F|nr:uncharacterized protein LOC124545612 [Schistocerca americana]
MWTGYAIIAGWNQRNNNIQKELLLVKVAALVGSRGSTTADAAAATAVASTTPTSTAAPARGLTISRWRRTPGNAANRSPTDGKVEPRLVQTAPLPEASLGVSGISDTLTGTKLALAQKLLEHPLIAKIIRPIVDYVSGTNSGVDGTGGELLNPSYFGSSFSFPFAFRTNFFNSENGTAEAADTKDAHPGTDDSKEGTSGDSVQVRDAKGVRPGGDVQHYRLAVAKRGRPGAPMPAQ